LERDIENKQLKLALTELN